MEGRTKLIVDRLIEKTTEHIFDWFIALPLVTAAWAAITAGLWWALARLRGDFTVAGWQLAALVAGLVVLAAVSVALWWRLRTQERAAKVREEELQRKLEDALGPVKPAPFVPIRVEDHRLNLFWLIKQEPGRWIDTTRLYEADPAYLGKILEGPFHAAIGCGEQVDSHSFAGSWSFMDTCKGCREKLFVGKPGERADLWQVRRDAIREICRQHRLGLPIHGPTIEMKKPLYWELMRPVQQQLLIGGPDDGA